MIMIMGSSLTILICNQYILPAICKQNEKKDHPFLVILLIVHNVTDFLFSSSCYPSQEVASETEY